MLATEVAEVASGRGGLRLINVKKHKTCQIALEREEFQWMEEFLTIRGDLEGGDSDYYFFNSSRGPYKLLLTTFAAAWEGMGLPGTPKFQTIRASVSTNASCALSGKQKRKVNKHRYHDEGTATAFYEAEGSVAEAGVFLYLRLLCMQRVPSRVPCPRGSGDMG
ncbi:UNVERIFIED_CONTAM: hypothetical protein FKN15_000630 [Acipenser sinensis]